MDYLTLSEAAPLAHATKETLRLWVTAGRRLRGRVIKLRALFVGGRWLTSSEWVREFMTATTEARVGRPEQPVPQAPRSPRPGNWQQEQEAAAKLLGGRRR